VVALSVYRASDVWDRSRRLVFSYSLPRYRERWPAALYEAGPSVLMLMTESKIPRIELNTVHLYQHYSLFMSNKLQYSWRGDCCEWVRPAHFPFLTEVRAPSLLEQYPRYVPHRDRAGYNSTTLVNYKWKSYSLYNVTQLSLNSVVIRSCTSVSSVISYRFYGP